ncbi:MAG: 30S ribosomal protein S2 [Patescibacteria group bacterium]|nr:30S ribosomal protein S2 [Patescibacteria group bacterium]
MREITLLEMLKCGVHFGHQKSRWHPKMKPFIFAERSGIHIIDLEKTQQKLKEALKFVETTVSRGGMVVFIGTKKQAQNIVKKYALESGMPYVVNRWIGGLFTNFAVVKKMIEKLANLKKKKASGELEKYTKKEKVEFQKEIDRLETLVGGISGLKKIPEAAFIVDLKTEKTALQESRKKGIPIIALTDTNTDPTKVTYPIPANDDATKSIELITSLMSESIIEAKRNIPVKTPEVGKSPDMQKPVV